MNSELPSPMDANMALPGDVGDVLRASRLRQGEELADVAHALRIRTVYLQAIEDGRYDDLPGTVYAIGFIRSYAEHLGLDGEQLVGRFKAEAQGQGRKTNLVFPAVIPEHGMPRGAVVTLGVIILTVAYAGWYFLSAKDLYLTDLIPPVPETIGRAFDSTRDVAAPLIETPRREPMAAVAAPSIEARPVEAKLAPRPVEVATLPPMAAPPISAAETPQTVPEPTEPPAPSAPAAAPAAAAAASAAAAPSEAVPTAPAPAAADAAVEPAPAEAAVEDEPDSTPAPTAAESEPAAQPVAVPETVLDDRGGADAPAAGSQLASLPGVDDPSREIVLRAVVDSWIEIRDTIANQKLLSRLLRKGDQYTVPPREGLSLVAGNAGGLEVLVGGRAVPSLGPLGMVRRDISLDAERLRSGTAIVE